MDSVVKKAYRMEIFPNVQQKNQLEVIFGCIRKVWNIFLGQRIDDFISIGKSDGYKKQSAKLTQLKRLEEYAYLNDVPCESLHCKLKDLQLSFNNYHRKRQEKGYKKYTKKTKQRVIRQNREYKLTDIQCYPQFKSKRGKNSFKVSEDCKLNSNYLYFNGFRKENGIKVDVHREVKGEINFFTISKENNRYFVSINTDYVHQPLPKTGETVGVDLGLKTKIVTSDGKIFENERFAKRNSKNLRKQHKSLSRKVKGSHSYEKQVVMLNKAYKKESNQRMYNNHVISKYLVNSYDEIYFEDLIIKAMCKGKYRKSVHDVGWGQLLLFTFYKASWNDRFVGKIDKWYPSSQICNHCRY